MTGPVAVEFILKAHGPFGHGPEPHSKEDPHVLYAVGSYASVDTLLKGLPHTDDVFVAQNMPPPASALWPDGVPLPAGTADPTPVGLTELFSYTEFVPREGYLCTKLVTEALERIGNRELSPRSLVSTIHSSGVFTFEQGRAVLGPYTECSIGMKEVRLPTAYPLSPSLLPPPVPFPLIASPPAFPATRGSFFVCPLVFFSTL